MRSRHCLVLLFAPMVLCGCGTVATVRAAFEMPVAPTPSPQELARAKKSRAFESLSKAIGQLNAQTLQPFFGKNKAGKAITARTSRAPLPFSSDPARALARDLNRAADVPVSPATFAVPIAPPGAVTSGATTSISPFFAGENIRTLATRRLKSASLPASDANAGAANATRVLLRGWEARESLRRADEQLLGRRALEDRIVLQSLGARPTVDLSLVSPETQLELTNLRLQLLPLLSVAPAKRAQARAQIEAIEARLNAIWASETARQATLLQQSLVEMPAKLRVEGKSALELQTREDTARSRTRLARVQRDLEARLGVSRPASALNITLRAAIAPDANSVATTVGSSISARRQARTTAPVAQAGKTDIARRSGGVSGRTAQTVAQKNDRIWRAATQ